MAPLYFNDEVLAGVDSECSSDKQVVKIDQTGLSELDYLFGAEFPASYNWKMKVFALHSRTIITEIRFTYFLKRHFLQIQVDQQFN